MTIEEILALSPEAAVKALQVKTEALPSWADLKKEYDPKLHPVYKDSNYQDITVNGRVEKVTRIALDLQRLSVKRTTELCFGIPVKRTYKPITDGQKEVAKVIEAIFTKNRIDSLNIERGNLLFASCEVATLWYAVQEDNTLYGVPSKIKLRNRSYSPMNGESIYPLFNEYGDLIALSFGYSYKSGDKEIEYLDSYSSAKHIRYKKSDTEWMVDVDEAITLGKIPAIYCSRPSSAWGDTSDLVYEIEWALSRNGNYLRKNSKPLVALFADQDIKFGGEKGEKEEFRAVLQYPKGSELKYVTWEQAIENLKFYIQELRSSFFTQLQLPDWSYDQMKTTPMSGEARKQMFIDSQLKVKDESGRLVEFLDREMNVIKAFVKIIMPNNAVDVDSLSVETVITPFTITDTKETVSNIAGALGGKAFMSQKEAVRQLGAVEDVEAELKQILAEDAAGNITDSFGTAQ